MQFAPFSCFAYSLSTSLYITVGRQYLKVLSPYNSLSSPMHCGYYVLSIRRGCCTTSYSAIKRDLPLLGLSLGKAFNGISIVPDSFSKTDGYHTINLEGIAKERRTGFRREERWIRYMTLTHCGEQKGGFE